MSLAPRYLLLAVGLTFFAATGGDPGRLGDPAGDAARGGGGCGGDKAVHAGCLGLAGGGSVLARAAGDCGGVARLGRGADEAASLSSLRHVDGAALDAAHPGLVGGRSVDALIGGGRGADALLDDHWADVSELVGRHALDEGLDLSRFPALAARHPEAARLSDPRALAAYAEADPAFYQDLGVELYLTDPAAWRAANGDELLELAALRSPAMRDALQDGAARRIGGALQEAAALPAPTPDALAEVGARHGVALEAVGDGALSATVRTDDLSWRVAKVSVDAAARVAQQLMRGEQRPEEEVLAPRLRPLEAEEAESRLEAELGAHVVLARDPSLDVAGSWAFRELAPGDGAAWVAADSVLWSGRSEDLPRLLRLARAGVGEGIAPEALGRLYVAFAEGALVSLVNETNRALFAGEPGLEGAPLPHAEVVEGGVRYRFTSGDVLEGLTVHDLVVARDGSVHPGGGAPPPAAADRSAQSGREPASAP